MDDFDFKSQVEGDIRDISKIFSKYGGKYISEKSDFESIILSLRDMLAKCQRKGKRISFTDDISKATYYYNSSKKQINDVTDLVTYFRDAIGHKDSDNNKFNIENNIRFVFNVAIGKTLFARLDGIEVKGDYEDDVAYFYGAQRIYLGRHIIRSFNEAQQVLKDFLI